MLDCILHRCKHSKLHLLGPPSPVLTTIHSSSHHRLLAYRHHIRHPPLVLTVPSPPDLSRKCRTRVGAMAHCPAITVPTRVVKVITSPLSSQCPLATWAPPLHLTHTASCPTNSQETEPTQFTPSRAATTGRISIPRAESSYLVKWMVWMVAVTSMAQTCKTHSQDSTTVALVRRGPKLAR